MKLTKEQLQEIMKMQQEMDTLALKNNNIDENEDLTEEKYIALKVELHEFMNEIESFKFWKKHKGKENKLEEAIDVIHFILSMMNDYDYEIVDDLEITDKQMEHMENKSINEIYIMTDALLVDAYMNCDWVKMLEAILMGVLIMISKCGFTSEDIYNEYIRKNKINRERQNKGY